MRNGIELRMKEVRSVYNDDCIVSYCVVLVYVLIRHHHHLRHHHLFYSSHASRFSNFSHRRHRHRHHIMVVVVIHRRHTTQLQPGLFLDVKMVVIVILKICHVVVLSTFQSLWMVLIYLWVICIFHKVMVKYHFVVQLKCQVLLI